MKIQKSLTYISLCIAILVSGCDESHTPKPKGYYRIELPVKSYTSYKTPCEVKFDVPNYSKLEMVKSSKEGDSCFFNLTFPKLNAKLHCTYVPVRNNYDILINDSYGFAAKHEIRASALKRTQINFPDKKVYGILYDIEGEAASQVQFFLSDSTSHFFRGSLYFYNPPNADSIAPVLAFLREDIVRLTNSLQWQ